MLDPVTASAALQAAGQIGQGLGQALRDPPVQQGGPATAYLDGSGWTVATGGSRAAARRSEPSSLPIMADVGSIDPTWLLAGLGLVAVVIFKRLAK